MEKDILQNNFETVYKEYKDYEAFVNSTIEEINKKRDGFKELVASGNESEEVLVSELFNLSIRPIQSDEDLRVLRDRLLNVYDAYKIVLDFPKEVIEELSNLRRPYQAYRIFNDNQVEIDKEKNEKFKEGVRKSHSELVKSLRIQ
jgi:hypothetical protein